MNKIESFKYNIKKLMSLFREVEKSSVKLELIKKLGISDEQLEYHIKTRIEEDSCLTSDQLIVIADVLDCSVDDLLNRSI